MAKQAGSADADGFWDDDADSSSEADCEKYFNRQHKSAAAHISASDSAENDDDDDVDDEDEIEDDEAADADEADELGTESSDDDDDSADDGDDEDEPEANAESSDHAEPSEASENALTSRGSKMAKKSAAGTKTKAEHIREIIAAKQAAGAEFRPRDIIAALEKRGVEVNASQVSITMRNMGIPATTRGGGKPKKAATARSEGDTPPETNRATSKRKPAATEDSADLGYIDEQLEAAADFIHSVGGYERAQSLLNMCHKLSQRI